MNLQKAIVRTLLKLPDPLLVALSGGERVIRDGRQLDARFQFIAASAAKRPLPDPLTPEVARWGTDLLTELFGGALEPGVTCHDLTIETQGRNIPARAYRPTGQNPKAPLMVFFHFGGGVVGNLGTCHAFCGILAKTIGCPVLSVDYRLAPEHPFPAGLDDCIDAFIWARDHASDFGAPAGQAAAGGDSMGGNATAILAQEMKRRGLPQPFVQLLIYPATDITETGGSMESCADAYPLTSAMMAWFMMHYLPPGTDASQVRLSPAKETDLSGLAPAIVATAGHDPLRDQGQVYARLLEAAGVRVQAICYDSMAHGFTAYTGGIPEADKACRDMAERTARAYRALGG